MQTKELEKALHFWICEPLAFPLFHATFFMFHVKSISGLIMLTPSININYLAVTPSRQKCII